jgi:hypothetical protein
MVCSPIHLFYGGAKMEIKDYCTNVSMELTFWKAKLYDVIHKMDQMSTGEKEKMYEHINGLHIMMTELEDRLNALQKECPTEWDPKREEINITLKNLSERYNDTAGILFDYQFSG